MPVMSATLPKDEPSFQLLSATYPIVTWSAMGNMRLIEIERGQYITHPNWITAAYARQHPRVDAQRAFIRVTPSAVNATLLKATLTQRYYGKGRITYQFNVADLTSPQQGTQPDVRIGSAGDMRLKRKAHIWTCNPPFLYWANKDAGEAVYWEDGYETWMRLHIGYMVNTLSKWRALGYAVCDDAIVQTWLDVQNENGWWAYPLFEFSDCTPLDYSAIDAKDARMRPDYNRLVRKDKRRAFYWLPLWQGHTERAARKWRMQRLNRERIGDDDECAIAAAAYVEAWRPVPEVPMGRAARLMVEQSLYERFYGVAMQQEGVLHIDAQQQHDEWMNQLLRAQEAMA